MYWLPLSLLSALSLATADTITKRSFSYLSAFEMGIIRMLFTLPWLILLLFLIPYTRPDVTFYLCIIAALPLECLAFFCYMKALKAAPISITLPFQAFTPAFIIITGRILLGESISLTGFLGIVLIVIGAYCLNISKLTGSYLGPIKAIFREKGALLMLLVAFIYSLTAPIGKLGIQHSNPYMFGTIYFICFSLVLSALIFILPSVKTENIFRKPAQGLLLGSAIVMMIITHMLAISLIQAAYMISIKRVSLLFGIIYGALVFKEKNIPERMIGAIIMLAGVFLIGFSA